MTLWIVLWEDNEGSDPQVDGPFTTEKAADDWSAAVEEAFGNLAINEVIQLPEPMDEASTGMRQFLADITEDGA